MHFPNEHVYLYAKVVIPALILTVWLILIGLNTVVAYHTKDHWMTTTQSRNILLCTLAILGIGTLCCFIPIPNHWFVHRQALEHNIPLSGQGYNSKVYKDNDRLWKVMQTLPNYNSNSQIEIIYCNRTEDRTCTLPLIAFRKIHVSMMMLSWERVWMLQKQGDDIRRFFPHIYYIDTKRGMMQVEKIGVHVDNMEQHSTQIHELDQHLMRLGLVIEDVDIENVMIDLHGQLKVIDFDYVLTKQESKWMRSFARFAGTVRRTDGILGSQNVMHPLYPKTHKQE